MKRIAVKELTSNVLRLPRLPVPRLEATVERYRASITALKSAEKARGHLSKLDAFMSSSGPLLQSALIEADQAAATSGTYPYSYIEALWDDMYLNNSKPILVHTNQAIITKKLQNAGDTQAAVAAAVVHSIVTWVYRAVREGVEVRDEKWDLSPLLRQFGASRIPGETRDEFRTTSLEKLRHIIVLHDGHPYAVRVFDEQQVPFDRALMQKSIEYILSITPDSDNTTPVSVLTAGSRQTWASAYAELVKTPENAENLKKIQEGIIVLCLDTEKWGVDSKLMNGAALHGNSTEAENRWYDKHQVIVSVDGHVAINFEHSGSDSMQWVRWVGDIIESIERPEGKVAATASATVAAAMEPARVVSLVQPLTLTFGKTFASHIRSARAEALDLISGTALEDVTLPFGSAQLGQLGVSPDAFVQASLHVAFHKCRNKLAPTYESSSTAGFFHGRTETIRSATREMLALAEAVNAGSRDTGKTKASTLQGEEIVEAVGSDSVSTPTPSAVEQVALVKAATDQHVTLLKAAASGEGVDRHLMALWKLAIDRKDAAGLSFFNDEVYKLCSTWKLSTSNVSAPWVERFMLGPVTANGYGVGYTIDEKETRLTLSAFTSSPSTDVGDMKAAVKCAAVSICGLLQASARAA
ncbi:putative Choline Carnitine o acyltransferase [Trypanosoma vivax]|uniref:Putative carnitine/choline acetyltransferase n=1 Tax=Trypanosoma vivax (strain Y486) TaxID=1055687 RepID=G0TT61_TRYVY|nr:putative carnitine/choline acetyltransferase [Trypanosoma vivax]KAH8619719.1 putative Choline Carnitine o acyltransferase [Trypanosoma vivax]CCC47142.1 putative carnitine/choline acetyltransferase [Trypanosoma vivax Y486]